MLRHVTTSVSLIAALLSFESFGQSVSDLPRIAAQDQPAKDWLIDPSEFSAGAYRSAREDEIMLDNGLVRRTFRVAPNAATIAFDNLMTGQSMLRGVKPEAVVTIDGQRFDVGGLSGQPNYAYLLPQWLDEMDADPRSMKFAGFHVGKPTERLKWKRTRHHSAEAKWPPEGVYLRMDYHLPSSAVPPPIASTRRVIWVDHFQQLDDAWQRSESELHQRTSFENEGKAGEIYASGGAHCFAQRELPAGTEVVEALIHPGTDQGVSWGPGLGLVFDKRIIRVAIRSGDRGEHGHFELRDNGRESLATIPAFAARDGGIDVARAYRIRVTRKSRRLIWEAAAGDDPAPVFHPLFETNIAADLTLKSVRVGKMDRQGGAGDDVNYPGELGRCRVLKVGVYGAKLATPRKKAGVVAASAVTVSVHYELYDGIPMLSKWITVDNQTKKPITVDHFAAETLAVVEQASWVESRDSVSLPHPRMLHVETDFAFGGFNHQNANRHVVHWRADPQYTTQVNYKKQTPCLLVVEPTYGPAQTIGPGDTFESCRVFELVYDSSDRERRALALKRMYRTIAPWVTENPLMHHLLNSNPQQVKVAIDQAAEVGFEMIILSFGSGFNMDNEDPNYLRQWKEVADYAASKNIEIGSYSLLSSRGAPAENMIVSPPGQRPTHGRCPALTSQWGQAYFQRMRSFFQKTGFDLLEHDGSYPGDVDITPRPPLQKGELDSRWVQWRIISDYYKWCRANGIYLNVPDYYFLSGSNKTGMGYREVNWSLPRAMQVIHSRQNIYDGAWSKTPTMGWMFVPLSQYHGGGAAATIEPLDQHLDHYRRMINCNLALGVQACYRGPRLFDTSRTKAMLKDRVDWFVKYRDILESDLVHGRRADGRDLDWMLHVNPALKRKGMLIVFNPTTQPIDRQLTVNLYYTGLSNTAKVRGGAGKEQVLSLARDYSAKVQVDVPAEGMSWYLIE